MKIKSNYTIAFLLLIMFFIISFLFLNITKNSSIHKNGKPVPIIIGFAQLGSESAWRNANTESIKSAAEKAGVSLIFKNAEGSQQLQKQIIQDFIIEQVDVIIFPPIVATGWDKILNEAKAAKIPVIIADRTIQPNNTNLYSVFVGEDFMLEGEKVAKWIIANTNPNKEINVVELYGLAGSSPALDRAKGFRLIIKKHPNINILESITGDFIKAKGKLGMAKLLKKHGRNINIVFAHNDDMALGAIEAIEEYGLKPGKDILILSIDGERAALQAIKDGRANVSVECTPLLGKVLMQTAKKLVKGEKSPKKIIMEEKIFTIENVAKELPSRTY